MSLLIFRLALLDDQIDRRDHAQYRPCDHADGRAAQPLVAKPSQSQTAENPPDQLAQGLVALIGADFRAVIGLAALARFNGLQALVEILQLIFGAGIYRGFICHSSAPNRRNNGVAIPASNGAEPTQDAPKGQANDGNKMQAFENNIETALSRDGENAALEDA